jgi:hypothetical protein
MASSHKPTKPPPDMLQMASSVQDKSKRQAASLPRKQHSNSQNETEETTRLKQLTVDL